MKRTFICILALLLTVCMLGACGPKEVELATVMDDINKEFEISGLTEIEEADKLELYYQIKADDVKQFAAEFSKDTSKNPQEIVLVEAVDEDAAKSIETSLKNILQTRLSNAKSYTPELVAVYDSCDVVVEGLYVSLIIDAKADDIRDFYDTYFE